MRGELRRLAALSEHEREVERGRLFIEEVVLTLRCPRCDAAFVDFTACMALTCACTAAFCGWCLADCGRDAHAHVTMPCPAKPRRVDALFPDGEASLHGEQKTFERHWRQRHGGRVREVLRGFSPQVRRDVYEALKGRLLELEPPITRREVAAM
jgi:hypothetical protein